MTAMIALSEHGSGKTPVFQYPTEVEEGMSDNETRMREWAQIRGEAGQDNLLPVHVAWQLNERMYGDLQGLNKDATREKYGADQIPHLATLLRRATTERRVPRTDGRPHDSYPRVHADSCHRRRQERLRRRPRQLASQHHQPLTGSRKRKCSAWKSRRACPSQSRAHRQWLGQKTSRLIVKTIHPL